LSCFCPDRFCMDLGDLSPMVDILDLICI
jgi:hypothetical protein